MLSKIAVGLLLALSLVGAVNFGLRLYYRELVLSRPVWIDRTGWHDRVKGWGE